VGRPFAIIVVNNLLGVMERHRGIRVFRAGGIIPDIRVPVRILLGRRGLRVPGQGRIVIALRQIAAAPSTVLARWAL
jgi:hypothetical protein